MCFATQRGALFRRRNFQKWSDHGVLCTLWLGSVLLATTACTSLTSQLPKWSQAGVFCTFWLGNVLRAIAACNFLSLIWPAGSAPAALASLLFDLPEPQIIGKHNESRLSYLFVHLHLLSSLSFSSLIFLLRFFSSLTLPTSAFPSVHIVGSLTSKLPSIIRLNFFEDQHLLWFRSSHKQEIQQLSKMLFIGMRQMPHYILKDLKPLWFCTGCSMPCQRLGGIGVVLPVVSVSRGAFRNCTPAWWSTTRHASQHVKLASAGAGLWAISFTGQPSVNLNKMHDMM